MERAVITICLPSLLAPCTGGRREVDVEAETLAEAIDRLLDQYPLLRIHLFDEERRLRRHVNLFHNDHNARWLESWAVPVRAGDVLTVIQAVSGG